MTIYITSAGLIYNDVSPHSGSDSQLPFVADELVNSTTTTPVQKIVAVTAAVKLKTASKGTGSAFG